MQPHRVLIGDQMPPSPSSLLDCSGIGSLIAPALELEETLDSFFLEKKKKKTFSSWVCIFLLSHQNTRKALLIHERNSEPVGLTFLFTDVRSSWHSQSVRTCERVFIVGEDWKTPSPSSSSAFIYYLSNTAHIFNYLPLAAVVNELFTLCWIMYHLVHKQRSLHTVPRWGGQEVAQHSGEMRHYGTLRTFVGHGMGISAGGNLEATPIELWN